MWERPLDGALPVSDYGCGQLAFLVVKGPEAGTIWIDDRADYKGVYPETGRVGDRVTFAQWYRDWLDKKFSELPTPPA